MFLWIQNHKKIIIFFSKEAILLPEMTKTELKKVVEHYIKNKDPISARNYIKGFGPRINGFDVEKELKKIISIK